MAHFRLGQKEKAQDYFKRFRQTMKNPRPGSELVGLMTLLREVEALLQPQTDQSKK